MSNSELQEMLARHMKASAAEFVAKGAFVSENQALHTLVAMTNRVLKRNALSVDEQQNIQIHKP